VNQRDAAYASLVLCCVYTFGVHLREELGVWSWELVNDVFAPKRERDRPSSAGAAVSRRDALA
jgi:hypothetical protein